MDEAGLLTVDGQLAELRRMRVASFAGEMDEQVMTNWKCWVVN